jgi:AcrR family transcriptional regulator
LDDIARDAGVGPGTLYRHFPAREELLEAVYQTKMEKVTSAAQKFAEELPRIEALRPGCCCLSEVTPLRAPLLIYAGAPTFFGSTLLILNGGRARTRTVDLLRVKQAL